MTQKCRGSCSNCSSHSKCDNSNVLSYVLSYLASQNTSTGAITNLSLTPTSTDNVVSNSNGTGFTIAVATALLAGLMSANDKKALDAIGITPGDPDLGTFTGTTFPDGASVKQILQLIETTLEALVVGASFTQYQDEGANLGTAGTATVINFTGPNITATRTGNTIEVVEDTMVDAFGIPIT